MYGRIVKPITEAADNTANPDLPVGGEIDFQKDVALNVTAARFVGVDRIGLADDLNRGVRVIGRSVTRAAGRCDCGGVTKAPGADQAIAAAARAAGSCSDSI